MNRCAGCLLPEDHCFCDRIVAVPTSVRFVVIRHASERRKASNTGRLAARALLGCTLLDQGVAGAPLDLPGLPALFGPQAWALLPTTAPPPDPADVRTVVVLDGTWPQVRQMRARIPPVMALPTLSLHVPASGTIRMRRAKGPEHLATIEAMAAVLEWLGEQDPADELRALFHQYTERVLGLRGMRSPAGGGEARAQGTRPW